MPRGGTRPGAGRKPGSRNLATLAREAGAATLTDLAREHTEWAIGNLREIGGNPEQSGPARVAATNALLDRGHGRPPQLTALAGALDLVPPGPREVRITLVAPDGTAETTVREEGGGGDPRVGIDD